MLNFINYKIRYLYCNTKYLVQINLYNKFRTLIYWNLQYINNDLSFIYIRIHFYWYQFCIFKNISKSRHHHNHFNYTKFVRYTNNI